MRLADSKSSRGMLESGFQFYGFQVAKGLTKNDKVSFYRGLLGPFSTGKAGIIAIINMGLFAILHP